MAYAADIRVHGISAVVVPGADAERAVLDLVAVLEGLVEDRFEIVLTSAEPELALDLQARGLPVRIVEDPGTVDATFDLVFVAARDGEFDVRQLNHLLDAINAGADVAAGYRPRRTDAIVRTFQRWGWRIDVDCAFVLVQRGLWQSLGKWCCAELVAAARRSGQRVSEVPVSHRRPTLGAPVAA